MSEPNAPTIRLWADPCCTWSWTTLAWLVSAVGRHGLDFSLKLISLAINDSRLGAGRNPTHRAGLAMENVIMAARLDAGEKYVLPLFSAMGRRIHEEGCDAALEVQRIILESVAEVGLTPAVVTLASDPGTGAALRAEHNEGVTLAAGASGSPILALGAVGYFGPVLGAFLKEDDGDRLLDMVTTASEIPEFFELKRGRHSE